MRRKNKLSIDEFDEDDMPCRCDRCGGWFDLNDGKTDPERENLIVCASCAESVEREREIEELNEQIREAEWTIKEAKKRLVQLSCKE